MSKPVKIFYLILGIVLTLTQVLEITLKLCGVLHISWFAVLTPLWVVLATLLLLAILICVACACVAGQNDREDEYYF